MVRPLVLGCLIAVPLLLCAQKRNNNWVFGARGWLSFNGFTPDTLPLPYAPGWRNASISDTAGNFLMVVDEIGVHNALFGVMPGGGATDLGLSGEQAGYLILPKPEAPGHYVLLVNQREDLKRAGWFEVDMALDGGLGAVVGGITWYMDSCTAKLNATPHGNGSDYWILQHEDGTDEFQAYQLTSAGVVPVPVASHAGSDFVITGSPSNSADFWGEMKFNVAGDLLALETIGPPPDTSNTIELYSFNDQTGEVQFIATIYHQYTWSGGEIQDTFRKFGGIEFDAPGEYLYLFSWDSLGLYSGQRLLQVDLVDLDQAALQASVLQLGTIGANARRFDLDGSMLQLAPDGHIIFRTSLNSPVPPPPCHWLINLPQGFPGGGTHFNFAQFLFSDSVCRFPNFCKRYNDSEPFWLGIPNGSTETPTFSSHPNPMREEAVLVGTGNASVEALHWFDPTGRLVRSDRPQRRGPSLVLGRKGLPTGMYCVRVLAGGRTLGSIRVVCE